MDPSSLLPNLLGLAVILPLVSFVVILLFANALREKAAIVATLAIGSACLLSFVSLGVWLWSNPPQGAHHAQHAPHGQHEEHGPREEQGEAHEKHSAAPAKSISFIAHLAEDSHTPEKHDAHHKDDAGQSPPEPAHAPEAAHAPKISSAPYTGETWLLGRFGNLRLNISYYIDSLTICMFCMVTLIATCIHFYASGYMHDELHAITDHEVHLSSGEELKRPGRFPRFFQSLSLFCFSMLGLVLAGNIAMVFVFWELVGICSYFLIGFYIERQSASTAANKAFIVNRVGDFGMIIGLMALWSSLGTFAFGDIDQDHDGKISAAERGLFSLIERVPVDGAAQGDTVYQIQVPAEMVLAGAPAKAKELIADHGATAEGVRNAHSEALSAREMEPLRAAHSGYWLLVLGGIGIFCGCVGKSAQFPLHVWLPDAMEGPTPVSALVHSATMVAAGVYLVGRFFPVFAPEVLLVIAITGCITLFLAATIAITATDIKRVLAYSTVSQLGYMMLAIGLGGWLAGLMHLITHAFFKSLLFMCSGSVIHAMHTNDMRKMGGLLKKMPVTAITMLIGCLAIAGVGVPFLIGFSGYYSKDSILEQAFLFSLNNKSPYAGIFFVMAAGGAAITAFYMFRMWHMTFMGKPRDQHAYDHAHESPPVMYLPLVVLATFAISVAWNVKLLGFGLVAAAFFIVKGQAEGWFKGSHADHVHEHDDHADEHDQHDHGSAGAMHSHDAHAQNDHAHHDHVQHDEVHAHGPTMTLTPGWTLAMLASSLVGGVLFMYTVGPLLAEVQVGGLKLENLTLSALLEQSRPANTLGTTPAVYFQWNWPNEHESHEPANFTQIVMPVTLLATCTWFGGILLASLMYWLGYLNPEEVRRQFAPLYQLLWSKWWFDELYNAIFVQPTLLFSRLIAFTFDRAWIDGFLEGIAYGVVGFAKRFEFVADRGLVDGSVNLFGGWMYSLGLSLRQLQTGSLRQYVTFIVAGTIFVFVLVYWAVAGRGP